MVQEEAALAALRHGRKASARCSAAYSSGLEVPAGPRLGRKELSPGLGLSGRLRQGRSHHRHETATNKIYAYRRKPPDKHHTSTTFCGPPLTSLIPHPTSHMIWDMAHIIWAASHVDDMMSYGPNDMGHITWPMRHHFSLSSGIDSHTRVVRKSSLRVTRLDTKTLS